MYGTYDRNWYGMRIYIATVVEICVGIICASVPSLRPLFVKLWPRFRRTTKRLLPGSTKNLSSDASSQRSRQHSHAFSFEPASKKRPSQTVFDLDFTEEEMAADGSERSIEKVVEDSSSGGTPSPTKEPKFITSAV
ncbi:MAG: hypothetical protein M1812_003748 [Candelaria pacifica]|nr:MAG: hypothetical protein M1812_003748 [Candelaria pacifica]